MIHLTTARTLGISIVLLGLSAGAIGCSVKMVKRSPRDTTRITMLEDELSHLRSAKSNLERQLAEEIGKQQVSVGFDNRGLVITFLDAVLFDSGRDDLRTEAYDSLDQVAKVLNTELQRERVGVAGHTDNQPITYSGWESNWELSVARAMSVLHYMVEERGVDPSRISATGYGEFQPVQSNDTADGQQQNRRVEIVILPEPDAAQ